VDAAFGFVNDRAVLDLNDLADFVRIVDRGGFSAAARALGVSKSTLSQRIARLEAGLGTRLIQRTSRRFVVTDAGRELYRHASAMLAEADAAESVVRGRLAEPRGVVRLTCSISMALGRDSTSGCAATTRRSPTRS
jgi:DNA-binding transcriptional LysR family regulator